MYSRNCKMDSDPIAMFEQYEELCICVQRYLCTKYRALEASG
jgi:hypothetical protein